MNNQLFTLMILDMKQPSAFEMLTGEFTLVAQEVL